jgi:hypothetical protein
MDYSFSDINMTISVPLSCGEGLGERFVIAAKKLVVITLLILTVGGG